MKTFADYPRIHRLVSGLKRVPVVHRSYRSMLYWIQHRENEKQRRQILSRNEVTALKQSVRQIDLDQNLRDLIVQLNLPRIGSEEFLFCSPDASVKKLLAPALGAFPSDRDILLFPCSDKDDGTFSNLCKMDFLEIGPRIYDRLLVSHAGVSENLVIIEPIDLASVNKDNLGALLQKTYYLKNNRVLYLSSDRGLSDEESLDEIRDNAGISVKDGEAVCLDPSLFHFAPQKELVDYLFDGGFESLQFTDKPWYREKIYPYQSIPDISVNAKRDMEVRWELVKKLIQENGLSLSGRMVLDVCCSSGIFMSYALSENASWALGWDIPDVAPISSKLQRILGFTRTHIFGAELNDAYSLKQDIPEHLLPLLEESVIFLFSAVAHVGFIKELDEIPWRFLVFEGHEADDFEERRQELLAHAERWNAKLLGMQMVNDGDSFPRPLAILVRN